MRALGLDLGERRVGVAVSDTEGRVATPLTTIRRDRDRRGLHRRIGSLVEEWGIGTVVVGLPLSLDGTLGPAARRTLDEVAELAASLTVPVVTHDERLTTVTADRHLRGGGVRGSKRMAVIDQAAAAVMLQAWLEGH